MFKRITCKAERFNHDAGRYGWIDGPGFLIIGLWTKPVDGAGFISHDFRPAGRTLTFSFRVGRATLAGTMKRPNLVRTEAI